jgi:hypothetical protein
MGFVGVYRAIYAYAPQASGELSIADGDLLYVLSKNDEEGWWKAKKKAGADDDDEPVGLVPNNYVEEVRQHATPSTDEPKRSTPSAMPRRSMATKAGCPGLLTP